MEDAVPEAVIPREDDGVDGEERQNPEAVKEHGEERADGGGGFITHLFSNFVNGGTNGDDGENTTKQAEKETIGAGAEGGNEEKGGGIFDHIISNLVSPSPRTGNISSSQGKVEAFDDTSASQNEAEEEGGGGGLISNFVSNLFHHSEGEAGEERNKRQKVEEGGEDQSKAEKTEDGGGIIDNIVSQLPTSLPDGAAPSSDEATILIHIVQD